MRFVVSLLALLWVSRFAGGDEPKSATPSESFESLMKELEAARDSWRKSGSGLTPENPLFFQHYDANPDFIYAPRLLKIAEANPKSPVAVDALLAILDIGNSRDHSVYPFYIRARDHVIRDFLLNEKVVKNFLRTPIRIGLGTEPYFRALIAKSPDHETVGRACMALVRCDEMTLRIAARPYFDHPEDHPERAVVEVETKKRLDPDFMKAIRATDHVAVADEIEALLERVAKECGDLPRLPPGASAEAKARADSRTLADTAKVALEAFRKLGVGQIAPEIEGTGLDGKPMKLSDFRGKVVVLVFWGTWCGPCMGMVAHEKEMVERFQGRPFALVGVNNDREPVKSKETMKKEGITWPSFEDGDPLKGPIARRWNVRGWPTIYVLDAKGVIRFKNLPHHVPKLLDEKVDALLKEMAQ